MERGHHPSVPTGRPLFGCALFLLALLLGGLPVSPSSAAAPSLLEMRTLLIKASGADEAARRIARESLGSVADEEIMAACLGLIEGRDTDEAVKLDLAGYAVDRFGFTALVDPLKKLLGTRSGAAPPAWAPDLRQSFARDFLFPHLADASLPEETRLQALQFLHEILRLPELRCTEATFLIRQEGAAGALRRTALVNLEALDLAGNPLIGTCPPVSPDGPADLERCEALAADTTLTPGVRLGMAGYSLGRYGGRGGRQLAERLSADGSLWTPESRKRFALAHLRPIIEDLTETGEGRIWAMSLLERIDPVPADPAERIGWLLGPFLSPDPAVQAAAATGIAAHGSALTKRLRLPEAQHGAIRAATTHADPRVRQAAFRLLPVTAQVDVASLLKKGLYDPDELVFYSAVDASMVLRTVRQVPDCLRAFAADATASAERRQFLEAAALMTSGAPLSDLKESPEPRAPALASGESGAPGRQTPAVRGAGPPATYDRALIPAYIATLENPDKPVSHRVRAAIALGEVGEKGNSPEAHALLSAARGDIECRMKEGSTTEQVRVGLSQADLRAARNRAEEAGDDFDEDWFETRTVVERVPVDCYTTRVVKTVTSFDHDAYRRATYVPTRGYAGKDRFGSPRYANHVMKNERVRPRDYWKEKTEETVEIDFAVRNDLMSIQSTSARALERLEQRK